MGMYMVSALDGIMNMNAENPNASKRFEQLPFIKRFALDPEARGTVTGYYDLKNATDEVVRTSSLLERTMNFEERGKFMQENIKLLANKDYILDLEKTMKEFRQMQVMIRSSRMDASHPQPRTFDKGSPVQGQEASYYGTSCLPMNSMY